MAASERFEEVIEKILPAAVVVESNNGHGSGTILTEDGIIVTNLHVIIENNDLSVKLSNGSRYDEVQILGFDEENDLAIIKVNGRNLPHVPLNRIAKAKVGQTVYALGAPEGLEQTLSKGIVSSVRNFEGVKVIQTDAAISSGSSGGGLFSQNGDLLGVLVSYYTEGQNLNFAIPSELINPLLDAPLSLSESEFFALEVNQKHSYSALNAMSSDNILATFLERAAKEYAFEYALSEEDDQYLGLYDEEVPIFFSLYDDLLLMSLPLVLDVIPSQEQFIKLHKISVNSNYSYIGLMNNNISVYAEMPIRNVQYEAFEAVFSGAITAYINAKDNDVIVQLDALSTDVFSEFPNTLPDITTNERLSRLSNYTKRTLPGNMAFYYDNTRFNYELVDEAPDEIEVMLTPIRHRVWAKVISEKLGEIDNLDDALVEIFTNYFDNAKTRLEKFEMVAQGTRKINGINSVWAQYEITSTGIRFKFQSTLFIINGRALTIHVWSPGDFTDIEKEMSQALESLEYTSSNL